ncbi:MAG: HAD-IIA family hydrolase [Actinomycetaceae bacterium]|nr:HAD-IIA family hydrolase [Actinomycetaceae bacterium]MDY5855022.1 HAD-IIA family hydrolase [Arcanobacterium sp.]
MISGAAHRHPADVAQKKYLASSATLSMAYDTLLLDLDGTTYLGAVAAPHAPEALATAQANGAQEMYLTNNSGRSPEVVARQLVQIGIPTDPAAVMNSSQVAAREAERLLSPGAKVLLVGGEGLRAAFANSSLTVVASADDVPDAVIQGLSEQATWAELSEAVLAIHEHGAIHIATNMDATIPKERGLMIGNGSFVACVQNATGSHPINCGKPEPTMYRLGAERAGARRALAIGDRLDTDIAGACAGGYDSLHVLTGVSRARDVMLAPPDRRPTYVGIDLRDVNTPHPAVTARYDARLGANTWECGAASATVLQGKLVMRTGGWGADAALAEDGAAVAAPVRISLDVYRAAVCALWDAIDSGSINPDNVQLPDIEVAREVEHGR